MLLWCVYGLTNLSLCRVKQNHRDHDARKSVWWSQGLAAEATRKQWFGHRTGIVYSSDWEGKCKRGITSQSTSFSVMLVRVFLGWTSTNFLSKDKCVLLKDTTQQRLWGSDPRPLSLKSSALPLSSRFFPENFILICDRASYHVVRMYQKKDVPKCWKPGYTIRDQARGQLGRNGRPGGRNFALHGTQGEVWVSLKKKKKKKKKFFFFFFFFFRETHFHSVITQMIDR